MINLLVFTLFCLAVTSITTWRYRNLAPANRLLSYSPTKWLVSFLAAMLSTAYYFFGEIPVMLVTPLLSFTSIAAALAIVGYCFHLLADNNSPSFAENVLDFTLFGMQRLLNIYLPIMLLLILASTQTTLQVYFENIIAAWIGLGSIYGSVYAFKKLKINFD